jgi:hypothetical protein
VWRCRGLDVVSVSSSCRSGGRGGLEEVSGTLEEVSEALEEVEGSEVASTKLWRRQEALEASGSSRGGRNLWRGLEVVEGLKRSKDLEDVEEAGGG